MKKIITLLAAVALSISFLSAQTPDAQVYYVEVYEISVMTAKSVCINYGVNAPIGKSIKIIDDNNQLVDFENALGALNFLGRQGWD